MRARTIAGLVALALIMGGVSGEIIYRSKICRDAIGLCFSRGRLLAAINGQGIYESDVKAEMAVRQYLAGSNPDANSEDAVLSRLVANEALRQLSDRVTVSELEVQHEFDLLRHEFGDDKSWATRMVNSGISAQSLRQRVRENLACRPLIEEEITSRLVTDELAVSTYYAQHLANFVQPMRLRVSHIFLAAPPETLPEIVQTRQKLIDSLAARLRGGEDFEALGWEESEDDASKPRGGDLGYLSQWRTPQDFFATVSQLKIGETSKPFRSLLGFHIVRVTEIEPARQMTFEEARPEIAARLTNQRRRDAVTEFAARLAGSSALRRGWFWN
jgi:parvulin-like peptidyl-prolyl isomerase